MKWIRFVLFGLLGVVVVVVVVYFLATEKLPSGREGPQAEKLADGMLAAIRQDAWDSTAVISWDFDGRHEIVWDKKRHYARVKWDSNDVLIDINDRRGVVISSSEASDPRLLSEQCHDAWKIWANDSFWLNPVSKIRDEGTSRSLVNYDGEDALLITYNKGGVTPGDSYLWMVDKHGLPYSWKMWVKIIPIGGLATSWENWITTETGVKISTLHRNVFSLRISDVRTAFSIEELYNSDIFDKLTRGNEATVAF